MKDDKRKRYVVRKYIMAISAVEAIRKEKTIPVDDVWVDEKWLNEQTKQIGFRTK